MAEISVIIPTHDRCALVVEAVESVLRQAQVEIIIVDDGSTDATAEVIARRFPSIRLVRTTGVGPGRARNAGVAVARGEVLMFLDSDDVWLPNHLCELLQVLQRGYAVAYGTTLTRDEIAGGEFLIPDEGEGVEGDCFAALLRWCFLVPSAVALRREAYDRVGGFGGEMLGEDWSFFLRLAEYFPFGFAGSSPITVRRLHNHSLCARGDVQGFQRLIRHVRDTYAATSRVEHAGLAKFSQLESWINDKDEPWSTVQQWYVAMRREGLV